MESKFCITCDGWIMKFHEAATKFCTCPVEERELVYQCIICGRICPKLNGFRAHHKQHPCHICHLSFPTKLELSAHSHKKSKRG